MCMCTHVSPVPRSIPDFMQPWRKIGREIKSGSGLRTRLHTCVLLPVYIWHFLF